MIKDNCTQNPASDAAPATESLFERIQCDGDNIGLTLTHAIAIIELTRATLADVVIPDVVDHAVSDGLHAAQTLVERARDEVEHMVVVTSPGRIAASQNPHEESHHA